MPEKPVIIVGAGPAGLSAAAAAADAGAPVLLLERDRETGGILNQCVHDGFGNLLYGHSLTGPEFALRLAREVTRRPAVRVLTGTSVLGLEKDRTVIAVNSDGMHRIEAAAVVLAMGCRERSRFQASLPGFRPAGVFTAGTAQRLINMEGLMPGERAVVLGSGDVGLIMARRLTLEGARVEGVFEIRPRPSGLSRNVVQCLEDFGIPLFLSHTIAFIHGKKRVEGVTVAAVDEGWQPDPASERFIPCDTVILSAGLIPENELSRRAGVTLDPATAGPLVDQEMQTALPGIFACGNVVHVHDLVDFVCRAAAAAGRGAARFASGQKTEGRVTVRKGSGVRYVVPQRLALPVEDKVDLYLRVADEVHHARVIASPGTGRGEPVEKKARVLRPPEAVHLELTPRFCANLHDGDELVVSVEGAGLK